MKKKDIFLIVGIILIAISIFFVNKINNSNKGSYVVIYYNNKLYKKLPLDKEKTVEIKNKGIKNIIHIHDNGVEMKEANCSDHICVKTGFIKDSSKSIVCLPHRINIKIISSDDADFDATAN